MKTLIKSAAAVALGLVAGIASAGSITLTTDAGGGVVGYGNFSSFRVESSYVQNGDIFTYSYNISSNVSDGEGGYEGLGRDLSHFIMQVSQDKTIEEIIIQGSLWTSHDIENDQVELGDFSSSQGNSNPGLPSTIHGIKFDLDEDTTSFSFSFDSYRMPMLGDFYAKAGGRTGNLSYAYNTYLDDTEDGLRIWVPNSETVVPEPATITLLGMGLGGAMLMRRRKNASK